MSRGAQRLPYSFGVVMRKCSNCESEYDPRSRLGQPGRVTVCEDCAEEPAVKYTGNMIYSHKTGCDLQINSNPALTKYISRATELRNKGSNLGNNLKVSGPVRGTDSCVLVAGAAANPKGRAE